MGNRVITDCRQETGGLRPAAIVAWGPTGFLPAPVSSKDAAAEAGALPPASAPPAGDTPGFDCVAPTEIEAGVDVAVVCSFDPGFDFAKATLRFRPPGRYWYFAQVMVKNGDRRWRGTLPGHMLVGRAVHLYVEVANREGVPVMTWNKQDSPYVTMIRASGGDGPVVSSAASVEIVEENPLDDERDEEAYRSRRFWVGIGIGDGIGWAFAEGPAASRARPAPSLDVQIAPEVGYHLSKRLAIAVSGRHQFIQQPARGSADAQSAHLGLLRFLVFSGTGRHRMFVGGTMGAGTGFRLVPSRDGGSGTVRSTVRGGPFVAGASVGYVGDLSRSRLGFTVETGGLVGFPDRAVVLDIRLGMAAYF